MLNSWKAGALLLCAAAAGARAQPVELMATYVVKPGDTLIGLARRGLRAEADWQEVRRLNAVGDVFRMEVGRPLRIPVRLLRMRGGQARVLSFRGDVAVTRGARSVAPAIGGLVSAGSTIRTGNLGLLTLGLPDGSVVTLPTRSELRIERLDEAVLTGDLFRALRLGAGRLDAAVTPRAGAAGRAFEVRTPVSTTAVRGTVFRVAYAEADGRAATGVIEGKVGVEPPATLGAAAAAVEVPEGAGLVATREGLGAPTPLLPPPVLRRIVPAGPSGAALTLAEVPGASRYRATVANDAGFIGVEREAEAATPELSLPGLPSGFAYVRLTAVTPEGLEGRPRELAIETAGVAAGTRCPSRRCLLLRWSAVAGATAYRVQFAQSPDSPPWAEDRGSRLPEIELDDPKRGVIYWRVGAELPDGVRWLRWQDIDIRPLPAARP